MTDWQRDLDDARATIEELTRERDEAREQLRQEKQRVADWQALADDLKSDAVQLERELCRWRTEAERGVRFGYALIAIKDDAMAIRHYPLCARIIALVDAALAP